VNRPEFPRFKIPGHKGAAVLHKKQRVGEIEQLLEGQIGDAKTVPTPFLKHQVRDSPRIVRCFNHSDVFYLNAGLLKMIVAL
jgi:hypothetical protein